MTILNRSRVLKMAETAGRLAANGRIIQSTRLVHRLIEMTLNDSTLTDEIRAVLVLSYHTEKGRVMDREMNEMFRAHQQARTAGD